MTAQILNLTSVRQKVRDIRIANTIERIHHIQREITDMQTMLRLSELDLIKLQEQTPGAINHSHQRRHDDNPRKFSIGSRLLIFYLIAGIVYIFGAIAYRILGG